MPDVGPDEVLVEIKKTVSSSITIRLMTGYLRLRRPLSVDRSRAYAATNMAKSTVYNTGKMGLVSCCGPMALGHESSGILVQLGSNVAAKAAAAEKLTAELSTSGKAAEVVGQRALKLGDKVTLEPGATCRMCVDCRSGQYQVSRAWSRQH